MENEQNEETIIEPQEENNEEELNLELDETTTEEVRGTPEPKKLEETPEAKHSRLKRQLEQHEKKMGIKPSVQNTAVAGASLSPLDIIAITRANVDEDDIADVLEVAQIKKISISEALKLPITKSILAEKGEQRSIAQATNTGATRRGTSKATTETLIDRASKGQLPESEDDIQRLWLARKGKK